MKLFHHIRNAPLPVLAVVVAGFGLWIAYDAATARGPAGGGYEPSLAVQDGPLFIPDRPTPKLSEVRPELFPRLKPGMSRAEVEGLLGPPLADLIRPVAETDGRLTYHTTYPVTTDAMPLNTVRPIGGRVMPVVILANQSQIALEFDATLPGHPLVNVQFSDPLF